MTAYKVLAATDKKGGLGQGGDMKVIALTLDSPDDQPPITAEWFTKATTELPAAGSQLEGEISQSEYGPKFKKARPAGFGGGGPRPEDPKRAAAIQRMHDQDMSLRTVQVAFEMGLVKPDTTGELFDLIEKTANWFGRDVEKAREAA